MSILDKIKTGGFSRSKILKLRENAEIILKKKPSDEKALAVIESINNSALSELQTRYFFVAFKPHSKIEDAVDEQWYAGGFYDLQYYEDPVQMGCTKAISHRDIELVEDRMPKEFWDWLATSQ